MTFAAPLFLLALLAGLIPVILYMISQQRAKTLPFGTLRFLQLSAQRTRRRRYVHDLLLLLLRVTALLLIGLALSRPTLTRLGLLVGREDASAVVLILDNSASLATVDKGGPRWPEALEAAHGILDRLQERDSLALLLPCGPSSGATDVLSKNHEVVRQALSQCQVRFEQADLAQQIRVAEKLLAEADAANKEIFVVTDMQAVSWNSIRNSDLRRTIGAPSILLVDVHRDPVTNVAIVEVQQPSTAPVAGMPMQVTAKLQGDPKLAQAVHIEWVIDGKTRQTSPTINIAPGETAQHSFTFTLDQPGIHRGQVRLVGDDACPLDNQRFFAVSLAPNISVAVVKASTHEIPYLEDAYFLERALTPLVHDDWAIRTTSLTSSELATEPLTDFAVVFCVNLPAVKATTARRLADYVRGGGHLVWTCGDHVDPVDYNAMNQANGGDLLPALLGQPHERVADQGDRRHLGWIDSSYPALSSLAQPPSLYQSVIVQRSLAIDATDAEGTRVLAKLDNGQPILVSRSVGAGSVLLLGTSVHTAWSNLPTRPLFLPLVAGLTFDLAGAQSTGPQLIAGAPLQIPPRFSQQSAVELTRPDGEILRMERPEVDGTPIRINDTHDVGIYTIRRVSSDQQFAAAVNLDPKETDAAISSLQPLRESYGAERLVPVADPTQIGASISRHREGTSLMEFCLVGLLLVLVAEVYMANRRMEKEQPEELRN